MQKRTKGWLIALVTVALASTAGCGWVKISGLGEPDPPYMVDRTEGWELSYTIKEIVEVERLDRGGFISKSWKELLTTKPVELLGPVTEEQVEECARKVLQETFGEAYLEPSGKNATVMESSTGSAWIYWDESVLVAFDKETGKVWLVSTFDCCHILRFRRMDRSLHMPVVWKKWTARNCRRSRARRGREALPCHAWT